MRRSLKSFLNHTGGLAFIEFALIFPFLFVLLFGGVEIVRMIYIQQKVEKAGHVISDVVARYMPATKIIPPATTQKAGEISVDEIVNNVFPIFARIMGSPATGGTDGFGAIENQAIIITSVYHNNTGDYVHWQIGSPGRIGGADANRYNGLIGCDTGVPQNCTVSAVTGFRPTEITPMLRDTPARFVGDPFTQTGSNTMTQIQQNPLQNGENMIITEVFYKYTPLLTLFLESTNLANATHINVILKPRIYTKRTFFIPRNGSLTSLPPAYPVLP